MNINTLNIRLLCNSGEEFRRCFHLAFPSSTRWSFKLCFITVVKGKRPWLQALPEKSSKSNDHIIAPPSFLLTINCVYKNKNVNSIWNCCATLTLYIWYASFCEQTFNSSTIVRRSIHSFVYYPLTTTETSRQVSPVIQKRTPHHNY